MYAFNEGGQPLPPPLANRILKEIVLLFSFFPRSDLMYTIIIIQVEYNITSKRYKERILKLVLK